MSVVFPALSVVSIVISISVVSLLNFCVAHVQLLFENAQNIEVAIENKILRTKICSC
jgi:hypothetical protein